ncbi:type 2 DNA topoisomerase 6 subunit B-like [Leucoraja erinacea]|uniref:type 2 DNA topoisomerase 6 subunit B-like n=1 Tax=Leucoraja erinaceus TaxID=7782 RepID=UPI002458B00D|nr:type 2 DNA topoisomerase 6 subunit B-like [Leucoraja erinacea]
MEVAVRQIIENLIIKIKHDNRKYQKPAELEAHLFVCVNGVSSSLRYHREGLFCTVTVAASGPWIANNQKDNFNEVIEKLLPQLSLTAVQPDTGNAHLNEQLISSPFKLTFEISERSSTVRTDCLAIKHFLHRISIVHPQLKNEFHIKVNGVLLNQTFGNEKQEKFCISGQSILCGSDHYIIDDESATHPQCCKLHPVAGKSFPLSVPKQLAEAGVCGLLEILPIAAICPCLKNYPNKPARISNVSVSFRKRVYSLCGRKWELVFSVTCVPVALLFTGV